jgi:osmotically-inducible protein OsmY
MFVRVTASNGTVYLTSSDSNEATRKRAVDVAAAVPGVATVEADMK